MPLELFTVADDEAVAFDGASVRRYEGLRPGADQVVDGIGLRTLDPPGGERLATVAAVNDLHFGETECGRLGGLEVGPVLRNEAGEVPYPSLMSRAAVSEIAASAPDLVVVKGDVTASGLPAEHQEFEACYRPPFGSRLVVTRGNHDHAPSAPDLDCPPAVAVDLPGATVAVLDTSRPGRSGGSLSAEQAEWLDELASRADRPVLVFGHHPPTHAADRWLHENWALDPPGTSRLVEVVSRRAAIVGYFAGHTHRNKVHHLAATGPFPWAEVACVKDFPGAWAEYRVHEGGILAVTRRISADPAALAWSERCRAMFGGLYPRYALGRLSDRCFEVRLRAGVC